MPVTVIVGTAKGGFVLRSNDQRRDWSIEGPLFKGWKVTASARADDGRYLVATASDVYGPALHASHDMSTWKQLEPGPAWPEDGDRKLNQIWTILPVNGRIYAAVDVAGLFASDDGGATWRGLDGLNDHETRSGWFPGAGGLCAHSLLVDPANHDRIWCGISAVGVFRSTDGGTTWEACNDGIPVLIEDEKHKCIGNCVHGLVADPDDADTIYRREHNGMFRSRNGGDSWERIENGLSSWFGFPIVMDRRTKSLYVIPLESDEYRVPVGGRLTVCRSRDGGDRWEELTSGLPQQHMYGGVLRAALDTDHMDPCGVYFGTSAGTVHASVDGGDSWTQLPCTLARVMSVQAYVD